MTSRRPSLLVSRRKWSKKMWILCLLPASFCLFQFAVEIRCSSIPDLIYGFGDDDYENGDRNDIDDGDGEANTYMDDTDDVDENNDDDKDKAYIDDAAYGGDYDDSEPSHGPVHAVSSSRLTETKLRPEANGQVFLKIHAKLSSSLSWRDSPARRSSHRATTSTKEEFESTASSLVPTATARSRKGSAIEDAAWRNEGTKRLISRTVARTSYAPAERNDSMPDRYRETDWWALGSVSVVASVCACLSIWLEY